MIKILIALIFSIWLSILAISQVIHQQQADIFVQDPLGYGLSPATIENLYLGHKRLFDDYTQLYLIERIIRNENEAQYPPHVLKEKILKALSSDPKIESIYLLSGYFVEFDLNDPETAVNIYYLGLKNFPDSYFINLALALTYGFKLNNPLAAARIFRQIQQLINTPTFMQNTINKLLSADKANSSPKEENELRVIIEKKIRK